MGTPLRQFCAVEVADGPRCREEAGFHSHAPVIPAISEKGEALVEWHSPEKMTSPKPQRCLSQNRERPGQGCTSARLGRRQNTSLYATNNARLEYATSKHNSNEMLYPGSSAAGSASIPRMINVMAKGHTLRSAQSLRACARALRHVMRHRAHASARRHGPHGHELGTTRSTDQSTQGQ